MLQGKIGKLIILNTSEESRDIYGNIDEIVETAYNFFGDGKTDMKPNGCDEYYKD